MKKFFFFAVLATALAAFGLRTGVVHAQTTSAASNNTASLQQQLDVAKATLLNLEMKAGMVPQGDDQLGGGSVLGASTSATPVTQPTQPAMTTGLTASQVSYYEGVLSQLVTSLASLNATIQANPNMSSAQVAAIASTLGNMQGTVSTMATQIAQDENGGSPVAMTSPSTNSNGGTSATAGNGGVAMTNPTTQPTQPTQPAQNTQPSQTTQPSSVTSPVETTAQASSIWSFAKTNWPVLVIIVLVIAILAILFWPEKEVVAPTVKTVATGPAPKAPSQAPQGAAMNMSAAPKAPAENHAHQAA